jgi:hypothetical protein
MFMRSLVQATPAYDLSVDITTTAYGHSLSLISFVPTARRPENHIKFQGVFSTAELQKLRDTLTQALEEQIPSGSRHEPGTP